MKFALAFLLIFLSEMTMRHQPTAIPDPMMLNDSLPASGTYYKNTNGNAPRQITIDPAKKTLVLIVQGQSNATSLQPTLYTPLNAAAVSHLNIYDGAFYPIIGPLLGTNYTAGLGPGNLTARIVDQLKGNGKFDQLLLANIALDGSSSFDWSPAGSLYDRGVVAMRRLAALGIVPGMPGVTFARLIMQGEAEKGAQTSTADYVARWQAQFSRMSQPLASGGGGFVGKTFICIETRSAGSNYDPVRAAQLSLIDNVSFFLAGDLDQFDESYRHPDLVHFKDNGGIAVSNLIVSNISAQY